MLVIEDILGRCAPLLGIDPAELRRRNFYDRGPDTRRTASRCGTPTGCARPGTRSSPTATSTAAAREIAAFNAAHPHTKRGLAMTPVKFGISFNFTAFNQAGALVHVYKDGSVLVNHGGTEMGQGLHTKMLQVAATALGVPLEQVRLAPTRTDKVPNTSATAATSGADLNGGAVKNACEQIRERLDRASSPSTATPTRGPELGASSSGRAYLDRVQLWAAGFYRTEGLHWDAAPMQGSPVQVLRLRRGATEVEVDGFTGAYRIRRVDIVHDVGDSLSPLVDLGQIEGGFVQGAGWLTLEDLRWDESDGADRGRLTTQAASTYKLPSFSEMPEEFNVDAARARPRGRRGLRLQGRRRAAADAGLPRARGAAPGGGRVRTARARSVDLASPGHAGGGVLGGRAGPLRDRRRPRAGVHPAADRGALMDWLAGRDPPARAARSPASSSPSPPSAATPRARPARRWSSPPTPAGARSAAATSSRSPCDARPRAARRRRRARAAHRAAVATRRPEHGVQCCGGEVTLLLEPLPVVPAVAIFGVGPRRPRAGPDPGPPRPRAAPGRLPAEQRLTERALAPLADALARVHVHPVPVLPELVLGELPAGTHVLVMTHDHAEDVALVDAALRTRGPRLDRADRLVGEVDAASARSCSPRARRSRARPGHHPDRAAATWPARSPPRSR